MTDVKHVAGIDMYRFDARNGYESARSVAGAVKIQVRYSGYVADVQGRGRHQCRKQDRETDSSQGRDAV